MKGAIKELTGSRPIIKEEGISKQLAHYLLNADDTDNADFLLIRIICVICIQEA